MTAEPLTIAAAAPLIRSGELTPSELLEQCLRRIDLYEPAVQAWVFLDRERARRDAARLTDEAKAGRVRGPLHGIPVGVKDIIDVFDMPTGCGSKRWANSYARRDATVVERLRQAGAVILGKTVTTPYAYLDPPPTRNPWDLTRTPGGSSSGSAAAVACGMCLAALGTQTGGSTIRPASYCGVCALKPTYGRLSVAGVQPLAASLDHIGIMANCVWDLAAVFQVMAGDDFRDHNAATRPVPDCTRRVDKELAKEAPVRTTFEVPSDFIEPKLSPEVFVFMGRVTADVTSLTYLQGWCHPVALPAQFHEIHRLHRLLMAVEAAQTHAARLERHPDDYPARITELVQDGLRTTAVDYRQALLDRDDLEGQCQNLCAPTPLLMPATLDLPPAADTTGDPWCNSPWSFLGFPVVTVPAGWSDGGLPLGVQVIDANWNEEHLLATAAHLERAFRDENPICPRRLPPVPG